MKRNTWQYVALAVILLVAASFRFYGLLWDDGYLFHPDERKIVLVASGLELPSSASEFLSPESPLNPKFFAYGSFPIYLLRALSVFAPAGPYGIPDRQDQFVALGILGRQLSALFDLGTIVLIFLLGRRLYDGAVGLIASACVAVAVLHIQLSHFYAVDTLLTLLVLAVLYFAARYSDTGKRLDAALMSICFGLALATKITAVPLIVAIVIAVVRAKGLSWDSSASAGNAQRSDTAIAPRSRAVWRRRITETLRGWAAVVWSTRRTLVKVIGTAFVVFVVTQPYMLLDPIRYFGQTGTELLVARGWLDYPYTRQYADTIPFVYQIQQSSVWGLGLPLGAFTWGGLALYVFEWWRTREWRAGLLLAWGLVYFLSVGGQFAKYLRYMLPVLPVLFLMAAVAFRTLFRDANLRTRAAATGAFSAVLLSALLYALAFTSIYSREHPWLQISRWLYRNVPAGSTLAEEHWDDQLPVPMQLGTTTRRATDYKIQVLPMYDADNGDKLQTVVETLASSDYIVLATRRLYATIPRLPARYPMSTRYYQLLFNGKLGFDLVAYAANDAALAGITITDDTFGDSGLRVPALLRGAPGGTRQWDWGRADESFTVYDHPLPLVFKKTRSLAPFELRALLSP